MANVTTDTAQTIFGRKTFAVQSPTATDGDNAMVKSTRDASTVTGGTAGYVNHGLYHKTTTGADEKSFEWGITGVLHNYSLEGENTGIYAQGWKYASGPTWAFVAEARDMTLGQNGALIAAEIDVFANGKNTANNRIGVDITAGKGVPTGEACEVYAGVRVASVNFSTDGYYRHGVLVGDTNQAPLNATHGVSINTNGVNGIRDNGAKTVGFHAAAAYTEAAFRMKAGDWFNFDQSGTIKMRYNATSKKIEFYNGSTLKHSIPMG